MADTPATVDVQLSADVTVIRPGDTAVVRMAAALKPQQVQQIAERLRERLPDVQWLVMTGVDGIDVYRPEDMAHAIRGGVFRLGETDQQTPAPQESP